MITRQRQFWLAVVLLLVVAASRTTRISAFDLDAHENYAVWQSTGTLAEIIRWTPYDWGSASFLPLGFWQALVGSDPIPLRYFSALCFMLAAAWGYAIARRLAGRRPALFALLIFAAPIGLIMLSLFTRSYVILIALAACALDLALRYEARSRLLTGALLVVTMALMIYIHATGLFAALMIGLFVLARGAYRVLPRWIPIGIGFLVLIAPEMLNKLGTAAVRGGSMSFGLNGGQLDELRWFVTGTPLMSLGWLLLAAGGLAGLLRHPRPRAGWLLLAWSALGLALMFILGGLIGSPRSAWWYLLPAALWIGWGLARLPSRWLRWGAAALALVITFAPIYRLDWVDDSAQVNPPLFDNFRWLAQKARWGDVVLVDPNSICARFPEEWDNAVRAFFPNGLRFVTDPAPYSRIWYISSNGWDDKAVHAAVQRGRLASVFYGPAECLFRLYAGPPDPVGVLFENGLRFHGVEVLQGDNVLLSPPVLHRAEALRLRLWWSVEQPLSADYSIAIHLTDPSQSLIAQNDGAPQLVSLSPVEAAPQTEMIGWVPGQIYAEERTIEIPALVRNSQGLTPLDAALVVYQWWDGTRIAAPGQDDQRRLPILTVSVRSF
jgi:hypothetical protein